MQKDEQLVDILSSFKDEINKIGDLGQIMEQIDMEGITNENLEPKKCTNDEILCEKNSQNLPKN